VPASGLRPGPRAGRRAFQQASGASGGRALASPSAAVAPSVATSAPPAGPAERPGPLSGRLGVRYHSLSGVTDSRSHRPRNSVWPPSVASGVQTGSVRLGTVLAESRPAGIIPTRSAGFRNPKLIKNSKVVPTLCDWLLQHFAPRFRPSECWYCRSTGQFQSVAFDT
jgi:hypothetical protein